MGTTNRIISEQLRLKEEPGTEGPNSNPNKQENRLNALPDDTSNELEKGPSLDKEKITSPSTTLNGSHLNTNADVSLKDHEIQTFNEATSTLQQKVKLEGGICVPKLDQVPKVLKEDTDQTKQRQSVDVVHHPSDACEDTIPHSDNHSKQSNQISVVVKQEAKGSLSTQIPLSDDHASHYNQTSLPKEELDLVEQSQISDGGIHMPISLLKQQAESEAKISQFSQVCIIPSKEKDGSEKKQHLDGALVPGIDQSMDACVSRSPSNQEIAAQSVRPDKLLYKLQPRRNLDSGGHPFEIVSPVATDDGYNWRKYGQKLVKGNVFIRSYYKCTYSNCLAKKQVERSHDGPLTDIKYIGTHEHPKPHSPQLSSFVSPVQVTVTDLSVTSELKGADDAVAPTVISHPVEPPVTPRQGAATPNTDHEGRADSQVHNLQYIDGNGGSPSLKKQKTESFCANDSMVRRTYCDSRHVVQTLSEVDLINDGYRWRKYGQKLVKGNPNPRSYYRCTNAGCQAKKHVERASHDSKMVVTTYEGKHVHDIPVSRSNNQNASESVVVTCTTTSRESRSELGEQEPIVKIDKAVDVGIQTD